MAAEIDPISSIDCTMTDVGSLFDLMEKYGSNKITKTKLRTMTLFCPMNFILKNIDNLKYLISFQQAKAKPQD